MKSRTFQSLLHNKVNRTIEDLGAIVIEADLAKSGRVRVAALAGLTVVMSTVPSVVARTENMAANRRPRPGRGVESSLFDMVISY